jgi:DNA-directed RNA polymerase specialized sigma24 family protein
MEAHWKFVLDYDDWLRRTARGYARGRGDWEDRLYEELIDRVPMVFATYDNSKGPLLPHVLNSLRFYAFKWVCVEDRQDKRMRAAPVPQHAQCHRRGPRDVEIADEVQFVLNGLSVQEKQAVVLRHVGGMTFDELAAVMQCSRLEAKRTYERGIARAREAAQGMADRRGALEPPEAV